MRCLPFKQLKLLVFVSVLTFSGAVRAQEAPPPDGRAKVRAVLAEVKARVGAIKDQVVTQASAIGSRVSEKAGEIKASAEATATQVGERLVEFEADAAAVFKKYSAQASTLASGLPQRIYLTSGDWVYLEGESYPSLVYSVDYKKNEFQVYSLVRETQIGEGPALKPEIISNSLKEADLMNIGIARGSGVLPRALEIAYVGRWVTYIVPGGSGIPAAPEMAIVVAVYPDGDFAVRKMPSGQVLRIKANAVQTKIPSPRGVSRYNSAIIEGAEVITADGRMAIVTKIENAADGSETVHLIVGPSTKAGKISPSAVAYARTRELSGEAAISGIFVPGCIGENCSGDEIRITKGANPRGGMVWASNRLNAVISRRDIFKAGTEIIPGGKFELLRRQRLTQFCEEPLVRSAKSMASAVETKAINLAIAGAAVYEDVSVKTREVAQKAAEKGREVAQQASAKGRQVAKQAADLGNKAKDAIRRRFGK